MAVIVDLRPDAKHIPNLVRILLSLIVLSVGVVGCRTDRVQDCTVGKPVWTTVVDRTTEVRQHYHSNGNPYSETAYILRLRADGFTNVFDLDVTKATYDRAIVNGKPNRLKFDLGRMTYGTSWDAILCICCIVCWVAGCIFTLINSVGYIVDYHTHIRRR